jgi:hypothetical protein
VNSYLVERYLPGLSEAELRSGLERAQALCHELSAEGIDVRYLGSIFLPVEEACFCRFESDGAETVVEVNQRAQLAFARITPGVSIAPGASFASQVPVANENPSTHPGGTTACLSD